ncbi:MAG TPA: CBS domain-containing protein [Sedimentisphaerales bacterium]|nr:CBS domain-containing protein [Sedimentisphaerales bacterium]
MFKANDVAKKMVITTRPDTPIYDAIRLMANRNLTALPVVDADLKLVGVLSERDVLRLLYETVDRANQTVADYMNTKAPSLDVNASLIDLCDQLMDSHARVVPLTENGTLAAIASRSDLIRGILRVKGQAI